MPGNANYKNVVITSIREETRGVKTFTLTHEDGSDIPYAAGQFITFVFTHHGKEERRSFSISSCAALHEPLSFTVKRIDNGSYSRMLTDRAKVGDTLQTTGAAGLFTIPEDIVLYGQVFFFAAGIGITPVFSLIKTLLHTQPDKQVVLVYSNRVKNEVVFYNELHDLAGKFPGRLKLDLLFSTSFNLARARLSKTLMPVLMREHSRVPKDKMLFYICGPFEYMRMVLLSLEEYGIDGGQVKKENFNTYDRPVKKAEPPEKAMHRVTAIVDGKNYNFPAIYPDTILQAAKKYGVALPYSCETGRCGSCAAICTAGKVWMAYNEVLMDNDLKKGMVLTCTGHPIDGDITIEAG